MPAMFAIWMYQRKGTLQILCRRWTIDRIQYILGGGVLFYMRLIRRAAPGWLPARIGDLPDFLPAGHIFLGSFLFGQRSTFKGTRQRK